MDLVNEIMVRPPPKRKEGVPFANFSSTLECRYKRKVGLRELELATVFIMQYKVNLREKISHLGEKIVAANFSLNNKSYIAKCFSGQLVLNAQNNSANRTS